MPQYVFALNQVGKIVGQNQYILKNISLSFFSGAKIGVLGLNGSGKSTLLKIMAGLDTDIIGSIQPAKDINIGYLPQEPTIDGNQTVKDNIVSGLQHIVDAQKQLEAVYAAYSEPDADYQKLSEKQQQLENIIAAADAFQLDVKVAEIAQSLAAPPLEQAAQNLSGGEKRRVALCRLLISNPDVLLLDEPTNHLDAASVHWLEQFLAAYKGTVVAITHDRYFLDNIAEWILELDRGQGIPYQGNYSTWLAAKQQRLQQESKTEDARQRKLKAEMEWARMQPKGRRSKNKARLKNITELGSVEFQKRQETNEIYIPPGPRLGRDVITLNNVNLAFDNRVLFKDLNLDIPPGAIVGLIGSNGVGKSTLMRLIAQQMQPDSGSIQIGSTVNIGFVDQSREHFDDNKSVWQTISDGFDILKIGSYEVPSRAYIGRFNFKGQQQQKLVGELSGGERGRLHLAHTLKLGANVLLLDEPSNDLDVETLQALEQAIINFPGSIVISSHDRWFLDRIVTHILSLGSNGQYQFFEGNCSEFFQK